MIRPPDDNENDVSDNALLEKLSILEDGYKSGRRNDLFATLLHCVRYQIVVPDWASDALLNVKKDLDNGKELDFNSVFGWDELPNSYTKQTTRKRHALIRDNWENVTRALHRHRNNGGSLNDDAGLGLVAEEVKPPLRIVKKIYRQSGKFPKRMPLNGLDKNSRAIMTATYEPGRRSGRKLLCGCRED